MKKDFKLKSYVPCFLALGIMLGILGVIFPLKIIYVWMFVYFAIFFIAENRMQYNSKQDKWYLRAFCVSSLWLIPIIAFFASGFLDGKYEWQLSGIDLRPSAGMFFYIAICMALLGVYIVCNVNKRYLWSIPSVLLGICVLIILFVMVFFVFNICFDFSYSLKEAEIISVLDLRTNPTGRYLCREASGNLIEVTCPIPSSVKTIDARLGETMIIRYGDGAFGIPYDAMFYKMK